MISVVVPTYNEEQNIERCLASLADQTVPRDTYEIIVVDGDSKDRTRELAEPLADKVFIQTSKRVGGARNDGAMAARGDIVATTDADCILPRDWVERIERNFAERDIVQLYGTVYPIEDSFRNRLSLLGANTFSRLGYHTRTIYFTLGCNTAFDREAFVRAGMYRCIDAGDDLEIAQRMRKLGKVYLDPGLKVGFSMRRYQQFGTLKSLWEWFYIVLRGGEAGGATYTQREYK
ncbi:putative glycosyltransferase EpsH [Methanoculleus chikugoensis]|jgi:glycosyltransferase involved in cell wall biosynthesis|uniref:Putative glycosyltransferase EpsH n=1 Tax=Methanoculleus chikugoensis TaxID=118126 RepID=A0A1M4MP95_9EURY|nr:glycosyltransferase [Methanoculleus chikugoensis]SCL76618.1 putative glycosyltransferase EpsH [Methanoculleus chikugoensis]